MVGGRDALVQAAVLLAATERIVFGTAIGTDGFPACSAWGVG